MNTTERIVESYFRISRTCFTMADVKVHGGNNRQLDLLAHDVNNKCKYHVEIGVTHARGFQPRVDRLENRIKHKFFGEPRTSKDGSPKGVRQRNFFAEILATYHRVGFAPENVRRIWVSWECREEEELRKRISQYCAANHLNDYCVEFISFRDCVIPQLMKDVGTPHYGDDALRTFSLLRARERQLAARSQKDRQAKMKEE